MSGAVRSVAVLILLAATAACSKPVTGTGTLAAEAAVVPAAPTTPATNPAAAPSPSRPTAAPAPRPRDPAAVARSVDVRATDLPGSWRPVPGCQRDDDSFNWVVACARDAGVSPASLSGAETPDYSPSGTSRSSQVGSATGVFPDNAAAHRFVALFRSGTFGGCLAAEAIRAWSSTIRGPVPTFRTGVLRVAGVAESVGVGSTATFTDGRRGTVQFFAVRTGAIVTSINTLWYGTPDSGLVNTVAARVAARQRTA